ncbi:MAG: hypothetical protein JXR51_00385 [Bacteroidales bacterium]|nr:hypothetical protein [Bacteroidales bacterium]MBN2755597.1 hypothetical protein [Bacteroidales bacterium]
MQLIGYYLFRLTVLIFKTIPFPVLYFFSDLIFVVFYYLTGYRKKVVLGNLKKSFPNLSNKEIKKISKQSYKNLSDITLESLKGFSLSKNELVKRYKVLNAEVLDKYYKKGKSVIAVGSHYANWEWGVLCLSLQFKHSSIGFYKPITNKYIDSYIRKSRAAWGMNLASIKRTNQVFEENKEKASLYFMVADQSPSNIVSAYWFDFLNQDTACLHGPENYAKQYNLPVIYAKVKREKRGFYTVEIIELFENSANKEDSEITRKFMGVLEKIIKENPSDWLWTHKRWKKNRSEIEAQRQRQLAKKQSVNQ